MQQSVIYQDILQIMVYFKTPKLLTPLSLFLYQEFLRRRSPFHTKNFKQAIALIHSPYRPCKFSRKGVYRSHYSANNYEPNRKLERSVRRENQSATS